MFFLISLFFQVASSISAVSVWIRAEGCMGHKLTIDIAQVDTYDKGKCIIEAVSI